MEPRTCGALSFMQLTLLLAVKLVPKVWPNLDNTGLVYGLKIALFDLEALSVCTCISVYKFMSSCLLRV